MHLTLEQFTGPYDMLLELIEGQQLPLTEVSLSTVTEQYLSYLDTLEETMPEDIADFLTVAAKLLLLKSSLLLPTFQIIEEQEVSLTDRLRLYEQFRAASILLAALWESPRFLGVHEERVTPIVSFSWPEGLSSEQLCGTMHRLVRSLAPPKPLPKTHIDKTVSLKETIERLRQVFRTHKTTSFWQHADRQSKTSVIIHFLALLELTKLGTVAPRQSAHFTDITIDVSHV